jgi:hypothetical protein
MLWTTEDDIKLGILLKEYHVCKKNYECGELLGRLSCSSPSLDYTDAVEELDKAYNNIKNFIKGKASYGKGVKNEWEDVREDFLEYWLF